MTLRGSSREPEIIPAVNVEHSIRLQLLRSCSHPQVGGKGQGIARREKKPLVHCC